MRIRIASRLLATLLVAALVGVLAVAQPLPPPRPLPPPGAAPQKPADDGDAEVLARGQLHEAFASSGELPVPSPVIDQRPPDPIEELPPDQRPEGENVIWIPGYWDWDEEDKEFTWISGFWRNAPAGRVWVPGDWRQVKSGWQWVPGFWNVVAAQLQQPAELEYLPTPPDLIEAGPSVVAPSDDCFYTPGCWVYRVNRYVWRPGFWVRYRPEWVWVPDHYRWTPCGYVFVPGFWDAPLATRGVLFAPVRFRPAVLARPRFVYTPVYVVPDTSLHTCLFVRSGRVSYYFGDYFEPRYVKRGFTSWSGVSLRGTDFAARTVVTRTTYDPLWSYYSVTYRDTPQWQTNVNAVYAGRFTGDVPRPPRTLVQQNKIVNVTNVTNTNTTVVVNNPPAAQPVLAPLSQLPQVASQPVALARLKDDERAREQKQATELRKFASERQKVETALVDKGLVVTKDEKPRQAKVEVPQAIAARAQERAKAVKPETAPPPPAAVAKKPDPKAEPAPAPKPVKLPPPPVVDPKTGAVTQPKKVDPAKPNDPPAPKPVDPVKLPVKPVDPPKPPVEPVDPPKPPAKPTEPPKPVGPPKLPVTPPTNPKPIDPPKPPVAPAKPVDPAKPPVTPPTNPKPKDPPKPADPPKQPVTPPAPKPVDLPKPPVTPPTTPKPKDPPVPRPVAPPNPPVTPPTPMPVDPPKPPAPKPVEPPKPPVTPPKPKDTPKVDPPRPPVTPPAPKPVDPPKAPPKPVDPPKLKDPPKTDPPKSKPPAAPPTKPKDDKPKKDDKGGRK